jgi:hypothetical protein
MREHHQRAIDRLTDYFNQDASVLGVIIGGSIAHQLEREDSDVDLMIVVTDEEFAKHQESGQYHFYSTDFTDYPGGYADGKYMDLSFLRDVAEKGSDPARFAFEGGMVTLAKHDEIKPLVSKIAVYPEGKHLDRIASFYGQVMAMGWFAGEAEKRNDPYLMLKTATDLSLFACRLILAHNRMLYPYHKWLMTMVEKAPLKPEGFVDRVNDLVSSPSKSHAHALIECVANYREWEGDPKGWVIRFFEDVEWTWRTNKPDIHEW